MSLRAPIRSVSFSRSLLPSRSSIGHVRCRAQAQPLRPSQATTTTHTPTRALSASSTCLKKSGKATRAQAKTDTSPPVEGSLKSIAVDDAFDLSELESNILKSMEKLIHELAQLRSGGRFNPDKLEFLKVVLESSDDGTSTKRTERLKDLAQVVAKGRNVSVLVHDETAVKAVNTAILSSALNLTPHGPTAEEPNTLRIQVPPPTGESRLLAVEAAKREEENALGRIKEARSKHQKKLRGFGVSKSVRPDDLQKAQKGMEECVKRGNDDVKKVVEDARRVLERA